MARPGRVKRSAPDEAIGSARENELFLCYFASRGAQQCVPANNACIPGSIGGHSGKKNVDDDDDGDWNSEPI